MSTIIAQSRLTYTTDYLLETLSRCRAYSVLGRAWAIGRCLVVGFLLVLAAVGLYQQQFSAGLILLCLATLCMLTEKIGDHVAVRNLRKTFHSHQLVHCFSEEGILRQTENGESFVPWNAISRVVEFNDGLLFYRPASVDWIPFSTFETTADAERVAALTRSKVLHSRL